VGLVGLVVVVVVVLVVVVPAVAVVVNLWLHIHQTDEQLLLMVHLVLYVKKWL
jgi:antibiotic biosynthesis monooxygenase (ABM) superfamily enzyme